jgi:hypothetical protein
MVFGVALAADPPLMIERFTWKAVPNEFSQQHLEPLSVTVLNNLDSPITRTFIRIDFYTEDGVKVNEGLSSMDSIPAHARAIYSLDVLNDGGGRYNGMAETPAYAQIRLVEGSIDGSRYDIPLNGEMKVWSPWIMQARLAAEIAAEKEAEKERKRAEKEKKKHPKNP